MGYKNPLDKTDIKFAILRAYGEISSPYNDGFTQWETKKQLYEIKFVLDEVLKNCPEFSGEEEWLKQQHQKQMWSELKR